MENKDGSERCGSTRTPTVRRLPTVGSLALALILGYAFGHSLWGGLAIYLGTFVVCMLILHLVFRQPLQRLLRYREFGDH
jgi:hypothetical protein